MRYVYVDEADPFASLLGFAILVLLAYWEVQSLIAMLPGILAFVVCTYASCSLIVRLARRLGAGAGLEEVRGPGLNPFASIGRAVDAFTSALPDRYGRAFDQPSPAAHDGILMAGLGGLTAFGSTCYASGALTAWQHVGRWSPTGPLVAAAVGAALGPLLGKAARGWLDRTCPRRPDVELLDFRPPQILDEGFGRVGREFDEAD